MRFHGETMSGGVLLYLSGEYNLPTVARILVFTVTQNCPGFGATAGTAESGSKSSRQFISTTASSQVWCRLQASNKRSPPNLSNL